MLEKTFTTTKPRLGYLSYRAETENGPLPTLIVLHGLFGMADNWNSIAQGLIDKCTSQGRGIRIIAVDLPGHGASDGLEDYSYESLARVVYQGLEEFLQEPVYLMGHSLGGKVAMTLADRGRFPSFHQLRGLVVVDIAPVEYPDQHSDLFSALHGLDLSLCRSRGEAQASLKAGIPSSEVRSFLVKNLEFDPATGPRWLVDLEGLRRAYSGLRAWPGTVKGFPGQALWIAGSLSEYMQDREIVERSIFSFAPEAKIEYIKGAGHWVHAEKRDGFIDHLNAFLQATEQEHLDL